MVYFSPLFYYSNSNDDNNNNNNNDNNNDRNEALLILYNKTKNLELKVTIYIIEYLVYILGIILMIIIIIIMLYCTTMMIIYLVFLQSNKTFPKKKTKNKRFQQFYQLLFMGSGVCLFFFCAKNSKNLNKL